MKKLIQNKNIFYFYFIAFLALTLPIAISFSLFGQDIGSKFSTLWLTAYASILALFIATFKGWLESLYKKPELIVLEKKLRKYSQGIEVWRLLIKNVGNRAAELVSAEIISITENDSNKPRDNFLPSPLVWTHRQKIVGVFEDDNETPRSLEEYSLERNVLPGQTAYLDVFKLEDTKFKLTTTINLDGHPDFSQLKDGTSILTIEIFEDSGINLTVNIEVIIKNGSIMKNPRIVKNN